MGESPSPENKPRSRKQTLDRVFAGGTPVTVEFELKTPTGLRRFESRAIPEIGGDGAIRVRSSRLPRHH